MNEEYDPIPEGGGHAMTARERAVTLWAHLIPWCNDSLGDDELMAEIERQVLEAEQAARADEREACAKECESVALVLSAISNLNTYHLGKFAKRIRDRKSCN